MWQQPSVGVTRNAEKTRTSLELRLPICVDAGEEFHYLEESAHAGD